MNHPHGDNLECIWLKFKFYTNIVIPVYNNPSVYIIKIINSPWFANAYHIGHCMICEIVTNAVLNIFCIMSKFSVLF